MAARATRSARGSAAASGSSETASGPRPVTNASFSEPREYYDAERTLTKLLDEMRHGRLPAQLLPLVNDFHTAVSADPCRRCHLLALSHDELGVIADGLADPLQPVVAVAFSSTCKGLRTPLQAALEVLKERHGRAVALWRKVETSCAALCIATELRWIGKDLTADDMATLAMILRTNGLPMMQRLFLTSIGDAGVQGLCDGLDHGAAPSLQQIDLEGNSFGPAGAEALAAALRRGAMPRLEVLSLTDNPIGSQGMAALATPLRKLPVLKRLFLSYCSIDDEGVASLVNNLGKDDLKALETLALSNNKITDVGCASIMKEIDAGGLPAVRHVLYLDLGDNNASDEATTAVADALVRRGAEPWPPSDSDSDA